MLRRAPDDETADRLLSGEALPGYEAVAAFVADTRLVAGPAPQPNAALASILAAGLDPVADAGAVVAPRPRKQRRRLVETVLAKVAAAGLVAKAGLAAGALTLTATAAGATGNLPVVQDQVADVVATVGVDIPGGTSAAARGAIDGTEPGRDRGKAVSDAVRADQPDDRETDDRETDDGETDADAGKANADDGKARADAGRASADARPAAGTPAPVETPAAGGSSTAPDASGGASTEGTDTAGTNTGAADAGAANADAAGGPATTEAGREDGEDVDATTTASETNVAPAPAPVSPAGIDRRP